MAVRLNPYLSFNGTARDAMTFYHEVLGGTLALSTYGDFGQAGSPIAENIMHAMLEAPHGMTLMGADAPPGTEPANSGAAISLSGDDEALLTGYWEKLSAGGTVTVALQPQMWGDTFGQCIDRFGTSWMVNIAGGPPSQ